MSFPVTNFYSSRRSNNITFLINEEESRGIADYGSFRNESNEFCVLSLHDIRKGYIDEQGSIIKYKARHYLEKINNSPIIEALR